MSDLLDKTEASLLLSYEAVIEKGLDTFLEVGTALKAIADGRLYRERHKTFDAYLDARWNMTRSWASRLIQAAEVVEMLPIGNKFDVTSESQARELAKAPQGKRAETLEKAKESAKSQGREKPTAKDIKEAVDRGSGLEPPHDATHQDDAEPRMAVMDGDDADDDGLNWPHVASKSLVPASGGDGPCPKGGDHDLFTIQGQRACGKCRTVFPADDYDDDQPSELEGSNDPIIADTSVDFDFAGMRDTCRWWLDNCPRECLVMLAAEFELWTNKAKELL